MPNAPKPRMKKVISLRDSVKGAVVEFLDDERMPCLKTQEGLVTLINALAHYTEEGRALFPEIFVFDSLKLALGMMPGSEHVWIGEGAKAAQTMAEALKRCAPLARTGWSIYIERKEDLFSYGLLRCAATVLSVGPTEILVDRGDPVAPVLMLHQVGANAIEVRGVSQSSLLVHFGAAREGEASPIPAINSFIESVVIDVQETVREQAATFYRGILMDVLHSGHGTLAAVVRAKKKIIPKQFSDAIVLRPPLNPCEKILALLQKLDSQSNMQLYACGSLVSGMLQSDGLTLLGTDGSVRAYKVFVKQPKKNKTTEALAGGARSRAFAVLSALVGRELHSAYMQSQDGHAEFYGGVKDEQ
jgi:hypothetical protein